MKGPPPDCVFPERSQQPSPEPHYIYLAREKFNQINVRGHSATWPDDQGRQHVLLSSSAKILYFSGELPAPHASRVPGWKSSFDLIWILLSLPIWLPLMLLL